MAFEDLRLTRGEIHSLCHWEGTKWAKEKYERDHNVVIRNTTWDGIREYEPRKRPTVTRGVYVEGKGGLILQNRGGYMSDYSMSGMELGDAQADEESEADSSDGLIARSMRTALNQNIVSPSHQAHYGGQNINLDPAWEQLMKDATERGSFPSVPNIGSSRTLAAFQAHIPAHYAFATPLYHFGPYSPASPAFAPTTATYYPSLVPQPLHSNQYSSDSYSARSTRGSRRSRSMR